MSGNKKVLFLTHWAKNMGGAEYSLADLLPETAHHAEVHLCTTESGRLTELFMNLNIRTHIIPCTTLLGRIKRYNPLKSALFLTISLPHYLYYLLKVRRLVKQIQPDCIHANVPKSHITLALLLLSGFRGTAVIHIREIFPRFSAAYLLYSLLFLFSDVRVIAISHAVKQALPSHLQSRSSVIHNGVTIAEQPQPFPPMSPVRFLYFGRIVPWKGCHHLIDAFYSLLQCVPVNSVNLTISGPTFYWNEAYRDYLTGLISNYQLSHLIHLDQGSDTPNTVYQQHHVLCMMSDNEPFGRVAAEAQACGRPVIAFDTGGLSEIIVHGKTGLLVKHRTIKAFSAAMRYFVDNRIVIKQMGKKGWKHAANHFDRTVQIPKIVEMILK